MLWNASAGRDFRPLVFTMPSHQARLAARIGELLQLPEPELFVYTCLDEDYEPWHEDEVLHEDYGTLVRCRSATPIRLNRQLVPWAKVRSSARFGSDSRLHGEPDGHIVDVEVLSLMGMGTFRRKILTDEMFRKAASRYFPRLRRIAPYIPEDEGEMDHWIYRLWE